jgi:hypothetical protein
MWEISRQPAPWIRLDRLEPIEVLDDYNGPRLFTVATADGSLMLAYQCGEDRSTSRYLLVPANPQLVAAVRDSKVPLRDALLRGGWSFLIDADRTGSLSEPSLIDAQELPANALPKEGVRLSPTETVLLRIRMIGHRLHGDRVPASVVKRTLDGATGALRSLSARALSMGELAGRPSDDFRKHYDLPAVEFGFHSFEIAFGRPDTSDDLQFDQPIIEKVQTMLSGGLAWAAGKSVDVEHTDDWPAIVEALAKLTPPMSGPIEEVEVSGQLASRRRTPNRLDRHITERVNAARRGLAPTVRTRIFEGKVRELDKDKRTFILRDEGMVTLCVVSFSTDQFEDVNLAFETDIQVTISAYQLSGQTLELINLSFEGDAPVNMA